MLLNRTLHQGQRGLVTPVSTGRTIKHLIKYDNHQPDSGSLDILHPTQNRCLHHRANDRKRGKMNQWTFALCVWRSEYLIMIGSFSPNTIPLIVFTNCKEAINHANESEPMSANTLVFIRTWGRGDCGAKASWKPGSFHILERSGLLLTNQLHQKNPGELFVIDRGCTWTSKTHLKASTSSCFPNRRDLYQTPIHPR